MYLHQIYRVLRVPLKEVRGEVSVRGTGLPVAAGIPPDDGETFLVQRLQLRSESSVEFSL